MRRSTHRLTCLAASLVIALVVHAAAVGSAAAAATGAAVYIRLNQVGYMPTEEKVALALTTSNLAGQTFRVRAEGGSTELSGAIGRDRGRYGGYSHLYELDLTRLSKPGAYRVWIGNASSPAFSVNASVYANVIASTLAFYKVQRCGDTDPALHAVCHLKDGTAKDGPAAGLTIDAAGGWHDAGDYLKFLINSGFTTIVLLTAYQHDPAAFSDNDDTGVPDLLDEARVGVDWIYKLWDPKKKILYYQVGDESDHDRWRMPEDDADLPARPVWACKPGRGANVAGKAAASLALASAIWGDPSNGFYDSALASRWLSAAKQIYAYGRTRPRAQSSTSGFYDETSWRDDMALAAAELYRATRIRSYLNDARAYAQAARNAYSFDYAELHPLAHYEIAQVDASYVTNATTFLRADLEAMLESAEGNPFHAAVDEFYWGSATAMTASALEALWYEELSGDRTYHAMAAVQLDYVLGANPWGVCWVNGAGTTWPRTPHHQIADLTGEQLTGFWDEGAINKADWEALDITLDARDEYSVFQSSDALYHDDVEDYGTNEPTINANAVGLALVARFGR